MQISATLSGTLAPTVPLTNGGQANIAVSNRPICSQYTAIVSAINSLDGGLTNRGQTDSGGAILATVSKKPFTFIVETERGLNCSIRAVPRAGSGRTIQRSGELAGTPGRQSTGKSRTPYESLLVSLNRAVRRCSVPDEVSESVPVAEVLQGAAGLRATAVGSGSDIT